MKAINTIQEQYKKTVDAIALGLLLQLALFQILPELASKLVSFCNNFGLAQDSIALENICSGIEIIIYFTVFFLPTVFISKYVPKKEEHISFEKILPDNMFTLCIAVIGITAVAGNLATFFNNMMSVFGIGFKDPDIALPKDITGVILLIISTAAVPALVEEILFRKVILNSLLPYGRRFAIIASAILFSSMHCNPSQFFYAFIAGILLAMIDVKCGSVIPSVIIHFLNNLISVGYLILYSFAPTNVYTYVVTTADTLLCLVGIILFNKLLKERAFDLRISDEEKQRDGSLGFSPVLSCVRLLIILYALYSSFLTARWIYII